ncbi:class I adenylate-forming enzyme family protein [Microbacterium sp. X-17]|uniref:class I adenylate-forming enzyme family protein n=1 Tax=Microbacterium sp. X-17 TaxID=3144404 RepID=UPI0031F48BE8
MNLTTLLEMMAEGMPDRVLLGDRARGLTPAELRRRAQAGARLARDLDADTVVHIGENGVVFPVALFAAAYAGIPFLPVNYRLSAEQLDDVLGRRAAPLIIADDPALAGGRAALSSEEFLQRVSADGAALLDEPDTDPDAVAVLLMTSGTTAAPKSAVLRHRHLSSYVIGSVEFMDAAETDATIVSVPPYHIAAVANLLSNLYAGRRIVYLDHFTADGWLREVEDQGVSHAMVVPTMLVRIVDELSASDRPAPASLRALSYGGAKIAQPVLTEALRLFPRTGFVNAYGLTETASTIALLGPEDHRTAVASTDPAIRARLGSVGRALPNVEIEIHDEDGAVCAAGVVGSIVVRGPQVAGEYVEAGSAVDADGWFPTRDLGYLDEDGYLFVQGRSDDTIIRGGENIAPSEIEAVLDEHPDVAVSAVAGIPDEEWGQRIAAFVVPAPGRAADADALRQYVRSRLRGSKTPDEVLFVESLPVSATGKLLRRSLVALVTERHAPQTR